MSLNQFYIEALKYYVASINLQKKARCPLCKKPTQQQTKEKR